MTEYLFFRQRTIEALRIASNPLPLLEDGDWSDDRVTKPKEEALVNWFTTHPHARALLLEELRCPSDTGIQTLVREPVLPRGCKPGDVDILLSHPDRPNEAVAVECKRVKVTPLDTEKNQVNKIDGIAEGVVQANQLRRHGFFRTFLCIITAVDAARQNHWNVPNRGIDPKTTSFDERATFKRIVEFPDREALHPEIGIIFLEIVQPTGRSIKDLVTIRICIHGAATPQDQPAELTNRIKSYLDLMSLMKHVR